MDNQSPTKKHQITHVIFDMDGLILDTEKLYEIAHNNLLKNYGKEYTFELKNKVMGRLGLNGYKILIDELNLPITAEEFATKMIDEHLNVFNNHSIDLMPGAEKLIKHLHRNHIPIAIATSSKRYTYELKTRKHKELFELFDPIVIAGDDPEIVDGGKPNPQIFLICAKRFKQQPADMKHVLVFEDSANGVKAANNAGMVSVWIPDSRTYSLINSNNQQSSLTNVEADCIFNSLLEFKPEQFGLPPYNDIDN